MPAPVEPVEDFAGTARFEIVRRIGAGGIGLVYEAIDREYGSRVALKTLQRLDSDGLLRFKNEFRMLQGLHHPNLVQLGELFEESGHWFFTMELLDGVDFMSYVTHGAALPSARRVGIAGSSRVAESQRMTVPYPIAAPSATATELDPSLDYVGPQQVSARASSTMALSPRSRRRTTRPETSETMPARDMLLPQHKFDEVRLRDALRQLIDGLSALHRAGMIHRDIKPHNVMVCNDRVVLLDFGLVSEERPWHRYDNETGLVLGTPTYMAPEQAAGNAASPASDWYGVGAMIYQALTNSRPFEGQLSEILIDKQRRDPAPPSQRVSDPEMIPADLESVCMKLLQRDPKARPSGAELASMLALPSIAGAPSSGPTVLGLDTDIELIGRETELDELVAAFATCASGRPSVAFVNGTSGMGKTALVEHFARRVRDREDALVLRGRCYEREAVPYKAFDGVVDELSRYLHKLRDAFGVEDDAIEIEIEVSGVGRRVLDTGSMIDRTRKSDLGLGVELTSEKEDAARSLLGPEFAVIARLFPVLEGVFDEPTETSSISSLRSEFLTESELYSQSLVSESGSRIGAIRDPSELRRRAFAALKVLLARLATIRPLVLVIDDLQWGDLDSTALLTEIFSPGDPPALLLIGSYRREEAQSGSLVALRQGVERALDPDHIHDIAVGPLAQDDALALCRAIWKQLAQSRESVQRPAKFDGDTGSWGEHLCHLSVRECVGSPFFLGEMMRYLASLPRDFQEVEAGRVTLDRVLVERRRQLSDPSRALLDIVAVAGRPIPQGVALRAAGLAGTELSALSALRAGHFVRTRGPALADAVEIYHDRIREAVWAQLGVQELRGHHGWLADALEDWGVDDPEVLAEHYYGAGRFERAAKYAMEAAANAERALAFDRAARMLRLILGVRSWSEPEERDLQIRLGDALGNAGRNAEAIDAYLAAAAAAAATSAPSGIRNTQSLPVLPNQPGYDMALECRRRAADQMFRSGYFDRGKQLFDTLVAEVGLRVAATSRGALLSLLYHRFSLRVRGLRFQARPPEDIPVLERQRADLVWSGALAISAIDLVRGADLVTRSLLMALRNGDEARIACALSLEAGHHSSRGGRHARRAVALTRRAAAIARRTEAPLARALTAFAPGLTALLTGRWRLARLRLLHAEDLLRSHCIGASWEAANARMFRCLSLYYLGAWHELGRDALTSIRHALANGDHYTAAVLDCLGFYGYLVIDDVGGARRTVAEAGAHWQQARSGYHLQHYLQLLARIQIDLYSGNPELAWRRLEAEWTSLRRSLLRRVQMTRIESTHLRARCALAMAALQPSNGRRFCRIAAGCARRIEREKTAWGEGLALLLRAGVRACRGHRERAIGLLEAAEEILEQSDMYIFAAAARRRRGQLMGGVGGYELVSEAERALRKRGVQNPSAVTDMLVPGFRPPVLEGAA